MSAHFLNKIQSEDLDGADVGKWQLLAPLVFWSEVLGREIVMPAGAIADSYSVPALLAFIVWGIDRRPAFIHDHLYSGREHGVTRAQADAVLLEACESVGIGRMRRRLIFRGPRAFGWLFYKGDQADADEPLQPPDPSLGG